MTHFAIVLGIGSSHGDDVIGWRVIDALNSQTTDDVQTKKLSEPMDIIDFLGDWQHVHVVDAATGLGDAEDVCRIDYSKSMDRASLEASAIRGSHAFGIDQTLRLAATLRMRTDHVRIWLGRAETFQPMAQPTAAARRAAEKCSIAITQEIIVARRIVGKKLIKSG